MLHTQFSESKSSYKNCNGYSEYNINIGEGKFSVTKSYLSTVPPPLVIHSCQGWIGACKNLHQKTQFAFLHSLLSLLLKHIIHQLCSHPQFGCHRLLNVNWRNSFCMKEFNDTPQFHTFTFLSQTDAVCNMAKNMVYCQESSTATAMPT